MEIKGAPYSWENCVPECNEATHASCPREHFVGNEYFPGSGMPDPEPPGGGCEACFYRGPLVKMLVRIRDAFSGLNNAALRAEIEKSIDYYYGDSK